MLSGRESTRTNLCTRPHRDSSPWACPLKVLFGVAKLLAVCCLLLVVPYLLPVSCALSSICSVWPIFYLLAWRAVGSNLPRTRHAAHELMGMTRIPPPCQQPRKDSAWARAASLPGWMEVLSPARRVQAEGVRGQGRKARGARGEGRQDEVLRRPAGRAGGRCTEACTVRAPARLCRGPMQPTLACAGSLSSLRLAPPLHPLAHTATHAPPRTAPGCSS